MPRIFDNIARHFRPALAETLQLSERADFCIGYFNLRGWSSIDRHIESWPGGLDRRCRVLVGMQRLPHDELRLARSLSLTEDAERPDRQAALRLKNRLVEEFREQLTFGAPDNEDEAGLRRLARQLKADQVVVKLFLAYPLHAKLYLLHRSDPVNPIVGYLGSSNLTQAGLARQGELNIDVLDHDACSKLAEWFEARWHDRLCIDISAELAALIDESWAREALIPPYHIYVKIAYHLSHEARAGLTEFRIPADFGDTLLEFQTAAVKIAAHHLNKRGGVLIGDVVGLGKTLMATALARIFEDDQGLETLIICPKNLVPMWEAHREQYRLRARVLSISRVINELPAMRRYRLLILDESHNLRNREGRQYRAIQEYIRENDCKCILLSATPYNKTYQDLSSQLRLFVPEEEDLGIRPERLLEEIGETEFSSRYQAPPRSLAAFEQSEYADDWRELMRLYLVRRTRSFIQQNYARTDPADGRGYLTFEDGRRSYFPVRTPRTARFAIDEQYARLFAEDVVAALNELELPRYGLGNYAAPGAAATPAETKILNDLSRAGKRLMGFCRTNLLKRLESGGHAFLLSVERHILRNYVFLHAIESGQPLPIGATGAEMLDPHSFDRDADGAVGDIFAQQEGGESPDARPALRREADFRGRAAQIYENFAGRYRKRFRWLSPHLFTDALRAHLIADAATLRAMLVRFGAWDPSRDAKLETLRRILMDDHPDEKALIFTQFADTAHYLAERLKAGGVARLAAVTGSAGDPTRLAWRFSPAGNGQRERIAPDEELRVLISTDVLSEGQNLHDCAIVINYDLPWAIIRLIQRAGRVDRIGQQARQILCYSFLPAEGIERLIQLRARVRARLEQNAEVVGADESFFEDEDTRAIHDLYNEQAGILDGDDEAEVDLASYAYQIWNNATAHDATLRKQIEAMPAVVHASKAHRPARGRPAGALVYIRATQENDALVWLDRDGRSVTESQFEILRAAHCRPDTPALPRHPTHHDLVRRAARQVAGRAEQVGGQLGRPSGARFRAYERLKRYAERVRGTLFDSGPLGRALDEIYRHPLRQSAIDSLNRQLRSGISDQDLAALVIELHEEGRLCIVQGGVVERPEPRIICSLGLIGPEEE